MRTNLGRAARRGGGVSGGFGRLHAVHHGPPGCRGVVVLDRARLVHVPRALAPGVLAAESPRGAAVDDPGISIGEHGKGKD